MVAYNTIAYTTILLRLNMSCSCKYRLNDSVGFWLNRVFFAIKKKFQKKISKYEIAPEQFGTLMIIGENSQCTQTELSNLLSKDKTTITRLLDSLERKRLILKVRDKNDKRAFKLELTSEAKELLREVIPIAKGINDEIKDRVSKEDLEAFFRVLETILIYSKGDN